MKITLQQAIELLKECSAIIVEGDALVYPSIQDYSGNPDNKFLSIYWSDVDGIEYNNDFVEGMNPDAEIVGSILTLIDINENQIQITLLQPWNGERVFAKKS